MFPNEPFDPETVEEQIADLTESLRRNQPQQQTRNLRLINHLQQLYDLQQSDPEALEHARQRVLQHLEEGVPQLAKSLPSHDDTTSNTRSSGRVISRQKRNIWHPGLLAAILLIGVLLAGTFFFARSTLHSSPSTVHGTTPPKGISNGSGGLNISYEPQPFLYQNNLYVNSGGNIRAYSAQNGAPERTYALAGVGNPTIVDGILYTSGFTSTSATRISDGKLLWQTPFGSESTQAPAIVNGVLYGCTSGNIIYALRISDGKLLWQYHTSNQNEFPTVPVAVQGVVYFTSTIQLNRSIDAQIYALKASDGTLMWRHTLGHAAISELEADGSTLYVFVDGSVEALRTNDGSMLWQYHLPVLSEIEMSNTFLERITNGVIYVAAGDGAIYAVQAADGKLLWRYQTNSGTIFSSFSIQGNALYVGMLSFNLSNPYRTRVSSIVALGISNGLRLWQYQMGEQEILAPTVGHGVIYVIYGTNGQEGLYALRAENGTLLWHRTLYSLFHK
ncbi:MAG TPA: PQQ-binding-like beta-propeller repeat protein [Ktedonobacteraceae bacterium]|nr:PQQ-binding-like beta-propeller repeat protein [Ktedonobacteraceae bacterium]